MQLYLPDHAVWLLSEGNECTVHSFKRLPLLFKSLSPPPSPIVQPKHHQVCAEEKGKKRPLKSCQVNYAKKKKMRQTDGTNKKSFKSRIVSAALQRERLSSRSAVLELFKQVSGHPARQSPSLVDTVGLYIASRQALPQTPVYM